MVDKKGWIFGINVGNVASGKIWMKWKLEEIIQICD